MTHFIVIDLLYCGGLKLPAICLYFSQYLTYINLLNTHNKLNEFLLLLLFFYFGDEKQVNNFPESKELKKGGMKFQLQFSGTTTGTYHNSTPLP